MDVWEYGTIGAIAYLLGSIPSGVVAARVFQQVDVRTIGSGHTGAINTFRAAGFWPAALALLADGAKGLLAISVARHWAGEGYGVPLAATLVVLGHCYPLFTRFHGGMGLSTSGGVFLALQPLALVALIITWFPLRRLLRESSYASIAIGLLLPILLVFLRAEPYSLAAGVGVGGVLVLRHLQVLVQRRGTIQLLR